MEPIQHTPGLSAYLAADEAIDHEHPVVRATAARLAEGVADSYAYARAAYEFVRDAIPHSHDSDDPRVTWRASDVLRLRTGVCHAKAHALAALLRGARARFSLAGERLAFPVDAEANELDYPVLYAEPHPVVLNALKAAPDRSWLWKALPTAL